VRFGEVPPFGRVDLTYEAMIYGLVQGVRILAIALAVGLYAAAVDPDRVLRLFRRAGFRSALTATLATRLVPVLARDARRLSDAQRGRARPAGRLALLGGVTAGALDRALDVAATLELRGDGAGRPSAIARAPWSRHDLAFAGSAALLAALSIAAGATGALDWHAYPTVHVGLGAPVVATAGAVVALALAPFAERRGIGR
jgi:energy-coupling factor transport system permease protein